MCNATTQAVCQTQGLGTCEWDTCQYSGENQCLAVYGCAWNGNTCAPATGAGTCRAPLKRMVRNNATKVSILMSDEEDCSCTATRCATLALRPSPTSWWRATS